MLYNTQQSILGDGLLTFPILQYYQRTGPHDVFVCGTAGEFT
jgi:hypothetical protein